MTSIKYMKLVLPGLLHYKKRYWRHDIVAALVVASIAIPQALAFAVIIGLPPVTGLYTAIVAPIVFALFAHSKRLVVGADSATAAVVASGAALVAQAGTAGHTNAVAIIGVLTAGILAAMALLRFGFLAELISRPVLIGFLAGVGVQLIVTSFSVMIGVDAHGSVWQRLGMIAEHLPQINGMTLTVSILVVGIMAVTRRTFVPGGLVGLVLAVAFSALFSISSHGVVMIGALPSGLPHFALPSFSLDQVVALLPAAFSVAMVVLAQSSAIIREGRRSAREPVKIDNDLFALGVANAATAVTGGFAANGSPPRTQAAASAGAKTQMVNILTGSIIALVLLFGASVFQYVPAAALSSIVFVIGFYLIRSKELLYLWDRHRTEFFVALVALTGTVLLGVLQGVIIAVIVSLAERLSRQYHPRDAVLLRDGEVSDWVRDRLNGDYARIASVKGLLVYNFDGPLFFENVSYFIARVRRAMRAAKQPVRHIVVDAGAIDTIDYTAAEEFKVFCTELHADGVTVSLAHVSPHLRVQLEDTGIAELLGEGAVYSTLYDALHSLAKK